MTGRGSIANRSLLALLRFFRVKTWASPSALRLLVKLSRRSGAARPPSRLASLCRVESARVQGDLVYELVPPEPAAFHVLFLHGGAYSIDISLLHWQFLESLIRQTGCAVTVPLYPLAPEFGCREAIASAVMHYRHLLGRVPARNVVVMGDSAGGGLSLALVQALLAEQLPQPGHIVLMSPWLDLTMSDPATLAYEVRDPILKVDSALAAARMYAGELALHDPSVSPIFGPVRGLAPMTVLTGTRDILNPQARRFMHRLEREGQSAELLEYPEMIHAWMLLPLPEAYLARTQIGDILMERFGRQQS